MSSQENATRVQGEVNALLTQAGQTLQTALVALAAAVEESEHLVAEAHARAREFNQNHASDWVLNEKCGVAFSRIGPLDVRRLLHNVADINLTPCELERGVLVKLSTHLAYPGVPLGAVVAISERECARLEQDLLVTRMVPPVTASPC